MNKGNEQDRALAVRDPHSLVIPEPTPLEVSPYPSPLAKRPADGRAAQYQTLRSQGRPEPEYRLPSLPSALSLTLAAVIALCFLVAASMFSIGLTAYSNAVDRRDSDQRTFIRIE